MLMLAIHPEYQEKIFEEQYNIFGDADRPVTQDDQDKMEYLEQVIKETLRLFPVAPLFVRYAEEDTKLTQNYVLPAGATAVIYPFFTHYDPELWPEPNIFNPDNFTAEKKANRHKYAFIPFSGGPRGCIGKSAKKRNIAIFRGHCFLVFIYLFHNIFIHMLERFVIILKFSCHANTRVRKASFQMSN
ncbi:cytochrome P450 4g15 isoform X1 [Bemisia tabaci]|uniref:cytochrome P450 4g15 isoform X1 n=1 Tax=Bemisia tabaci TaxID=7038 RepID=UPI003B281958